MVDYYSHPAIKARIAEFLGTAPPSGSASCIFLITGDEHQLNYLKARKVSELTACLEQDFEICRSLWDSVSLLVDLDIEYVNFDFPAEPYLHPHRTFALRDVVERTVEKQLLHFRVLETLWIAGLPECHTAATSNLNSTRPPWGNSSSTTCRRFLRFRSTK